MKSIEIKANGRPAYFSTKSLFMEDEEYQYTGITDIKHSTAKSLYLFQYEGKWHKLEYQAEDEAKLKVLFGKIIQLQAKRAEALKQHQNAAAPVPQAAEAVTTAEAAPEAAPISPQAEPSPYARPVAAPVQEAAPIPAAVETEATETPAVEATVTEALEATDTGEPVIAQDEPAPIISDEETVTESITTAREAFEAEEEAAAIENQEQIKKSRFKKAIIIFAIIIVVFAIVGLVWYHIAGPSSNPNIGPNSDGTQQYNDIDDLIDDLQ